jgi:outer membrane murein-binding lipoprotein Lpp
MIIKYIDIKILKLHTVSSLKGRIENLESENEFLRSQAATAKEQKAHPEKI